MQLSQFHFWREFKEEYEESGAKEYEEDWEDTVKHWKSFEKTILCENMSWEHKSRLGDILLRGEIDLGHDLYIQARIKEKRTGRVISRGDSDDDVTENDAGFFDICWWCGSPECDVRIKMIEICNNHGETGYTDSDFFIPIPLSALRTVYAQRLILEWEL